MLLFLRIKWDNICKYAIIVQGTQEDFDKWGSTGTRSSKYRLHVAIKKMSTEFSTTQLLFQGSIWLMTENVSILSSMDFSSLFSLEWWLHSVDVASQHREDSGLFKLAISEMSQVCSSPYTQPFLYTHIPGLPDSLSVLRSAGPLSPQRNSPAKNLGVFIFSL